MLSAAATAAPVRIGPDTCAAPADATAYRLGAEVEAEDLNVWRIIAEEATPIVDIDVAEPPTAQRVFERYAVDPEIGEVFAMAPGGGCETDDKSPRQ